MVNSEKDSVEMLNFERRFTKLKVAVLQLSGCQLLFDIMQQKKKMLHKEVQM